VVLTQSQNRCMRGPLEEKKWPRYEINDSPPFNTKVKNAWKYISTPPNVFMYPW
jgi:hypothetical protein